jgi:hypothetical protein
MTFVFFRRQTTVYFLKKIEFNGVLLLFKTACLLAQQHSPVHSPVQPSLPGWQATFGQLWLRVC